MFEISCSRGPRMPPGTDAFSSRVKEIESFFELLTALEDLPQHLQFSSGKTTKVDPEWVRLLKGTAFLLLYNLVEASINEAMSSLYSEISSQGVAVHSLTKHLREVWIDQNFKRLDASSASLTRCRELAKSLVTSVLEQTVAELDSDYLPVSGNLDADRIRTLCQAHAIPVKVAQAAKGGKQLSLVRERRNGLAHGDLSFAECGRDFTLSQLIQYKREVVEFVRSTLSNVRKYARSGRYRV